MLKFGIECEVAGGTSDILDALDLDGLHDYHCHCNRCDPRRSLPDWTAQADCTADGEFISRILTYGSDSAAAAISNLASALKSARATHTEGQGLHIHVATDRMTPESWVHFWRTWFRFQDEIAEMARGRYDNVRGYNSRMRFSEIVGERPHALGHGFWTGDPNLVARRIGRPYSRTTWVNPGTGHGTAEFRLWNATRVAWRIHLAVGVSVALVQSALDGQSATRSGGRSLHDLLAPYFTPATHDAYAMFTTYTERNAA